jgi:hypothetical protein
VRGKLVGVLKRIVGWVALVPTRRQGLSISNDENRLARNRLLSRPRMRMFLVPVTELIPAAVLAAAVAYERWRRKRSGNRPPQTEKLLREAGHSLRVQLEERWDKFNMWFAVAMVGGIVCGFMLAFNVRGALAGCLTAGSVAAVGTAMAWRTLMGMRPYRLGLKGEQAVAEHLQGLVASGYRVFNDVPGDDDWNIDHVVVGPSGVFAIETKTRTKKPGRNAENDHTVNFDGARLIFPSGIESEAPEQVLRNAKWIGSEMTKATGERVTARPLLVVPGWFVVMKVNSELKALNPKQVLGYVLAEPKVLNNATIQRIAYQLEQRCRDVEF